LESTEAGTNGFERASSRKNLGTTGQRGLPRSTCRPPKLGLLSIESQRGRVDAVPKPGRPRPVVEYVSQMGTAVRAFDFGPPHEQTAVHLLPDPLFPSRLPEARPSGPRIELVLGRQEFSAAS